MPEYLQTLTVPANDSVVAGVPSLGIAGIYCDGAVDISWNFNGIVGLIKKAATEWEPNWGFHPASTSQIIIKNNGATAVKVAIRCLEA